MRIVYRVVLVALTGLAVAAPASAGNFVAHLDQNQTVPHVSTLAQGQLVIHEGADGLRFTLLVANLLAPFAAHIHCGPVGEAGQVGVTLFLDLSVFAAEPVDVNGILAQGPITGPDSPNGCGWFENADVIDAIEAGQAYVNVHTVENQPGEIRGQIE